MSNTAERRCYSLRHLYLRIFPGKTLKIYCTTKDVSTSRVSSLLFKRKRSKEFKESKRLFLKRIALHQTALIGKPCSIQKQTPACCDEPKTKEKLKSENWFGLAKFFIHSFEMNLIKVLYYANGIEVYARFDLYYFLKHIHYFNKYFCLLLRWEKKQLMNIYWSTTNRQSENTLFSGWKIKTPREEISFYCIVKQACRYTFFTERPWN